MAESHDASKVKELIGQIYRYGVNAESIELGPLPDILGYKKC